MAFSESFGFGNNTLQKLESQVKRAMDTSILNDPSEKDPNTSALDIIEESPTQVQISKDRRNSASSRTRSRILLGNSTNAQERSHAHDTKRRRFRKSKSDSTLSVAPPLQAADNFSDFFRSDFTFSVKDKTKKEDNETSAKLVLPIEAQFKNTEEKLSEVADASTAALEVPIFSDDVMKLLQTDDAQEESQNSLSVSTVSDGVPSERIQEVWHNSIPLKALAVEDPAAMEEVPMLDASSFISSVRDSEAAQQLKKQLEQSRRDVVETQIADTTTKVDHSKRLAPETSCMFSEAVQLQWSPGTPSASDTEELNEPKLSEPAVVESVNDAKSLKSMSSWNLPQNVLWEYEKKGVVNMFDWQVECLSNAKVLFEHCNLVYSAPTSAGKTLVSELLLIKTVLERGKKVLLILPFISVVREKMFYLQDLLTVAGYRVEGFFGGYTPPGGFDSINVAICTIEKANSIVNKLLEQGKLDELGTVVVDEVHLISDPGRGYILELLLAKILYMCRKYDIQIQVITMSATLANIELLKDWLNAEIFITDFRPVALKEMIKVGTKIYDNQMRLLRDVRQPLEGELERFPQLQNDADHVAQLCFETLLEGCSVIVFCPSKDWCENLAVQLAGAVHALGTSGSAIGKRLRSQIKRAAIDEVKAQLRDIPTGLDAVLEKTVTFGCAYHHAGLTTEERDIVEASFKSGALKIIVATSTLSSGVNLPARRVLIRSPLFGGKQMSSLTYKQMIGRAGRTGKDTLGESILICADNQGRIGRDLVTADIRPISSCLDMDSSTHLKRALLEVISSGVAASKDDINSFVNCTLLSAQKRRLHLQQHEENNSIEEEEDYISGALDFLIEYEFIRLQVQEETHEQNYVATRLGLACLASSMPPTDGLILFSELQKSRRCFVLESELHAVYLVTPYSVCYQLQDLDWLFFLDVWERLSPAMKKVGELVGVKESFLVRAMRGQSKLDYKLMQIHKRFYTALALQELVNETPINVVAAKYKCTRGMLQSLQQMASTFAGIVTAFCNSLQWSTLSLIVSQFKERLYFGIHRDLIDLMRLPDLSHKRARSLYDAGITSLVDLANADVFSLEKVLYNALSFDSVKQHEHENSFEAKQRNTVRNFFITGKAGLTVAEAAKLLVQEARQFVQYDMGIEAGHINWTQAAKSETSAHGDLHMSCENDGLKNESNKRVAIEEAEDDVAVKPTKVQKVNDNVSKKVEEKPSTSKEALKLFKQKETETRSKLTEPLIKAEGETETYEKVAKVKHKNHVKENEGKEYPAKSINTETRNTATAANTKKQLPPATESESKKLQAAPQTRKVAMKTDDNKAKESKLIAKKSANMVVEHKIGISTNNKENINKGTEHITKSSKSAEAAKVTRVLEAAANQEPLCKPVIHNTRYALRRSKEAVENNSNSTSPYTKTTTNNNIKHNGNTAPAENFHTYTKLKSSPANPADNCTNATHSSKLLAHPKPKGSRVNPAITCSNASQYNKPKDRPVNQAILSNGSVVGKHYMQTPTLNTCDPTPTLNACELTPTLNTCEQTPNKNTNIEDLFMDDESFELNTGIIEVLVAAQTPLLKKPLATAFNKSHDEIPSSQQLEDQADIAAPNATAQTPHSSRYMRSFRTQRLNSMKAKVKTEKPEPEIAAPTSAAPHASSSIEFSDISLENSLLKNPMLLNASHIMSCSKVDTDSSNFKCIEIIDICGNQQLFKEAFKELLTAQRIGFCLGLQQQLNKRKPCIGANLLINQQKNEGDTNSAPPLLFQINDVDYLAGVAFSIAENVVYYMNMQQEGTCDGLNSDIKWKYLRRMLSSSAFTLLIFDAKEQLKVLRTALPDLGEISVNLEDPKVGNWLLQPDKALHFQHLTQQFAPECSALVNLYGNRPAYTSIGLDSKNAILPKIRCSIEACVTVHILKGQIENLERIGTGELRKFFTELEMPLQLSLCNMETFGFPANESALRKLFQRMVDTMKKVELKIYELHGTRFNLSSSSAVARVLGLHRKTNGRVSTCKQILEKIDTPISQLIVTHRKLSATLAKNIQPLLKSVQKDRIHGQSITFTATGRISMTEPNLQSVAKDFEVVMAEAEKFTISCRGAFYPTDAKRCLISADFCQLEMRILAHLSQDATLLNVMHSEQDIFIAIASHWNKIPEDRISEQLRNGTKQICYGIVYGMGMRSLAEALKCTEQEANMVSEQFHASYTGIKLYADKVVKFARSNGYIETITGRRRYLDHINSGEPSVKNQAERQALNSTIQGSAADIAKSAILRMEKNISKYRQKLGIEGTDSVRLVLHLHDELMFEVPEEKAKKIAKVLSVTMENCVKLSVPLKVKLKIGRSWGQLREIKL